MFTNIADFPIRPGITPTCWEAGTGCTTGAWADDDVRSAATLVVVSEPPSELCMLRRSGDMKKCKRDENGGDLITGTLKLEIKEYKHLKIIHMDSHAKWMPFYPTLPFLSLEPPGPSVCPGGNSVFSKSSWISKALRTQDTAHLWTEITGQISSPTVFTQTLLVVLTDQTVQELESSTWLNCFPRTKRTVATLLCPGWPCAQHRDGELKMEWHKGSLKRAKRGKERE